MRQPAQCGGKWRPEVAPAAGTLRGGGHGQLSGLKRIGVVGGGIYGTHMLRCFAEQQQKGRVELAALCERDDAVRERQAARFAIPGFADYREMMDQGLDAVIVATPDHLHADLIAEAIARKLHVLTQKPLDVDLARAETLVENAEKAGTLVYVDFHKRFDPAHMRLREEIAAGRLGRLHYAYAHMEDRIGVPLQWRDSWAAQSSPSWFLGVHFYDLVDWLTGLAPQRVLASGHRGRLDAAGIHGAWDSIQVRVDYAGGFVVNYDLSWILPNAFPSVVAQGIRLVGDQGIVEIDSQDRGYRAAHAADHASIIANPFSGFERDHPLYGRRLEGYVYESMTYFIDMLEALDAGKSVDDLKGHYPRWPVSSYRDPHRRRRGAQSGKWLARGGLKPDRHLHICAGGVARPAISRRPIRPMISRCSTSVPRMPVWRRNSTISPIAGAG